MECDRQITRSMLNFRRCGDEASKVTERSANQLGLYIIILSVRWSTLCSKMQIRWSLQMYNLGNIPDSSGKIWLLRVLFYTEPFCLEKYSQQGLRTWLDENADFIRYMGILPVLSIIFKYHITYKNLYSHFCSTIVVFNSFHNMVSLYGVTWISSIFQNLCDE